MCSPPHDSGFDFNYDSAFDTLLYNMIPLYTMEETLTLSLRLVDPTRLSLCVHADSYPVSCVVSTQDGSYVVS